MPVLQFLPLAISAVSSLADAFTGGPDFPLSLSDINRLFDIQLETGLNKIARDTSRRLSSAGLEASGALEPIIADIQERFRAELENRRQQAIKDFQLMKFQADSQARNRLSRTLQGLSSLGSNIFLLSGGLKNFLSSVNPLSQVQSQTVNLESGINTNFLSNLIEPQPLQPRFPEKNISFENPLEFTGLGSLFQNS